MFVVWTGRGYVVFLIFGAALLLAWPLEPLIAPAFHLSGVITGETSTLDPNFGLMAAIGFALASVLVFPVSRFVLKQPVPKILIDPKTGKSYAVNLDTIYRIETKHWTFIFAGACLVLLGILILTA